MGLRTMAFPNGAQAPHIPLLNQGGSFYNHSLDEYLRHFPDLSKLSNDMNLDELLNAIQQAQAPTSSSSSSSALPLPANYNLNGTFGRKAVDEVWQDIIRQEEQGREEKLVTFGETTLENILIPSGAINPGYEGGSQSLSTVDPVVQEQAKWLQYELDAAQQPQQQSMALLGSSFPMFGNTIVNAGFAESQQMGMPMVSVAMTRPTSSDSQTLTEMNRNDESIDKSIERRQKRMIKNRESAARSRARKQAYINQLEEEVRQLTETNKRLKKQKEEMLSHLNFIPEPRYQLRRTSSAQF